MKEDIERVIKEISDAIAPENMSQEEALDFLNEIAAQIEGMIDGIEGDMKAGR